MKIGEASGVRAVAAAPATLKVVSFLTFSSLASTGSVGTSSEACFRYGRSALGGRGPSYF